MNCAESFFRPDKGPGEAAGNVQMIYRFSITVLKILFASLVVGFAPSTLNITAEQVMTEVDLSPERALVRTQRAIAWAVPHLLLGSMVIIPLWIIVSLFRPKN